MKVSNCKAPSFRGATHFDRASASCACLETLAASSSPNCVKTLNRTMFTSRRIHNRFIVFTESFKERSVWCHSNKLAGSIEALLAFGFCSCSRKSTVQFLFRIWFAFVCLIGLFSLLFHLQLLFGVASKTSSDNLGDAIQFLREFDHEAAEMCNR